MKPAAAGIGVKRRFHMLKNCPALYCQGWQAWRASGEKMSTSNMLKSFLLLMLAVYQEGKWASVTIVTEQNNRKILSAGRDEGG